MKVILHIGQYKTGSTSIQDYLLSSRLDLLAKGILYPNCLISRGAHFKLSDKLKKSVRQNSKFDKTELFDEINTHQPNTLLLSTEALSADVMSSFNPNLIYQCWERLSNLFTDFELTVCYYYREQRSAIESRLNQIITSQRYNKDLNIQQFIQHSLDLDYQLFNNQILKYFNKSIPIPFVRKNFHNSDLIQDFCQKINIPFLPQFKPVNQKNVSTSNQTISFLKEIQVANIPNNIKEKLIQKSWQLNNKPNSPKARILKLNELKTIKSHYEQSNTSFLQEINAPEVVKVAFTKPIEPDYTTNIINKGARFLELMHKSLSI